MTFLFHIAAVDVENIIPFIIVIGVIISKIIKAATGAKKNLTNPASQSDEKEPAYRAAPNELRNFLETLTGIPQETKAPTVTVPPLPVQQVAPPKAPKRVQRVQQQTVAKVESAPPVATKEKYRHHTKSANFNWGNDTKNKQALASPAEVANELISRKSLAKAILLKEILGPPIALREG